MRKDQRDGSTDPQMFYHRNLSTEHTEDTDFLSTEDTDHRNLNGYFGVARAQEILEEIFLKNGREPEMITIHYNL